MIVSRRLLSKTKIYDDAQIRLNELRTVQTKIMEYISKAPPGKIRVAKNGNTYQFYLRNNGKDSCGKYISKSKRKLISTYLQKKYNEKILKLISIEINNLENFLNNSSKITTQIQTIFSSEPNEIKEYIIPVDVLDDDLIREWCELKYVPKEKPQEVDLYQTDNGELVRSKSELNIANMLYKMGIPYKYECPLKLKNGVVIYPDFTLLNLKERRVQYWEHRGMMDDKTYSIHSVERVKDYQKNDLILGRDLIITEETQNIHLTPTDIVRTIEKYIL